MSDALARAMNLLHVLFGGWRVTPYEESIDTLEEERHEAQRRPEQVDRRLEALTELVLVLAAEVEGLRGALARVAPKEYGEEYRKALVLSNNAAGVSPGTAKLLARFYSGGGAGLREEDMLRRLGISEAEIAAHRAMVEEVRTYT